MSFTSCVTVFLRKHVDICSSAQPLCRILTYDLNFIGGVDFPRPIEHPTGVSAAVLWCQVPQTQSPLLLTALPDLLFCQRRVVLQPHDVRPRVSTGRTFESHRAAHRAGYHPFSHLSWLNEAGAHCGQKNRNIYIVFSTYMTWSEFTLISKDHTSVFLCFLKLTKSFWQYISAQFRLCCLSCSRSTFVIWWHRKTEQLMHSSNT